MAYSVHIEKAGDRTCDQCHFTGLKSHKVNFRSVFGKITEDLNVKYEGRFVQASLLGESLLLSIVEC